MFRDNLACRFTCVAGKPSKSFGVRKRHECSSFIECDHMQQPCGLLNVEAALMIRLTSSDDIPNEVTAEFSVIVCRLARQVDDFFIWVISHDLF